MRISREKPEQGEWQTDSNGKRYRMVGNYKEYEMEINGMPQSIFLASQKAQKERDKARYAQEQIKAAERAAQRRYCPYRDGMYTDCIRENCALFADGCTLARLTPSMDTVGLQCPFSRYRQKCRKDCAMYRGGCTFTGLPNTESEDK